MAAESPDKRDRLSFHPPALGGVAGKLKQQNP